MFLHTEKSEWNVDNHRVEWRNENQIRVRNEWERKKGNEKESWGRETGISTDRRLDIWEKEKKRDRNLAEENEKKRLNLKKKKREREWGG